MTIHTIITILVALLCATTAAADPKLLHPIERIAYSSDWRSETIRHVPPGASTFVIIRTGSSACVSVETSFPSTTYAMAPTPIGVPSGRGGQTGVFYEALVPLNPISCKLSEYILVDWTPMTDGTHTIHIDGTSLRVDINRTERTRITPRPFFVGMANIHLVKAHCRGYCPKEGELGRMYNRMLVDHGLQPIQNWARLPSIRNGRLDLDNGQNAGRSFRQLVMTSAISGLIGFPRASRYKDPIAYLRALEATVIAEDLQGQAWVYAVDEPKVNDALKRKLSLYRLFAPSVRVMVTTPYRADLADLVDIFAPVYNQLMNGQAIRAGTETWSYPSCMGSCGPRRRLNVDPVRKSGPDTGMTDFLIDRPAPRLFQYFRNADKLGLVAGLYYEATEGYQLAQHGHDLIADPWNYGGNGDGLLLYPGRPGEYGLKSHQPLPSFRLKLIRHALQHWW